MELSAVDVPFKVFLVDGIIIFLVLDAFNKPFLSGPGSGGLGGQSFGVAQVVLDELSDLSVGVPGVGIEVGVQR